MSGDLEKVYGRASLAGYSLKERILIRLADWAFYILIRAIGATIRFETEGLEHFDEVARAGKTPIYAFWHDRIFLATYYFRNKRIAVITSQSFDGEYIAGFIQRFGYGTVRGSSTRGGVGALVQLIRVMKSGSPAGFSIDGPKGPRYVAKPGPIMLAKKTGNPIVPFIVETAREHRLKSWDRMSIPMPFSRAKVIAAEPIYVSADADEAEIDGKLAELQKALDDLVSRGEEWRQ